MNNPRSFDFLGAVAIVKFPRGTAKTEKTKFAFNLMKENKSIKSVLEKTDKFKGRLRKQETRYLAGEKTKEILYRENDCVFRFNIDNTYFSPRLSNERKEVARGLDYLSVIEKRESPLIWIFIDEAHEFLPQGKKTVATDALTQLLREGRQPGISIVLATQQPGQIHNDVMTQSDIVISHKVTSHQDLHALSLIMQSYLLDDIKKYMNDLPNLKGSAIILDDNSERIYIARIRPRFTWHGGEAPSSIKVEKRL